MTRITVQVEAPDDLTPEAIADVLTMTETLLKNGGSLMVARNDSSYPPGQTIVGLHFGTNDDGFVAGAAYGMDDDMTAAIAQARKDLD